MSAAGDRYRFDAASARRILEHAAAEQQRLRNERAGAYSLEELEEMAAEAGISETALRAAIDAQARRAPNAVAAGRPHPAAERARRERSALGMLVPRGWSPATRSLALVTAGAVGFAGFLLAFPALAGPVLWGLVAFLLVVTVLVALGAAPF